MLYSKIVSSDVFVVLTHFILDFVHWLNVVVRVDPQRTVWGGDRALPILPTLAFIGQAGVRQLHHVGYSVIDLFLRLLTVSV
jgi:hypothetical protein